MKMRAFSCNMDIVVGHLRFSLVFDARDRVLYQCFNMCVRVFLCMHNTGHIQQNKDLICTHTQIDVKIFLLFLYYFFFFRLFRFVFVYAVCCSTSNSYRARKKNPMKKKISTAHTYDVSIFSLSLSIALWHLHRHTHTHIQTHLPRQIAQYTTLTILHMKIICACFAIYTDIV